MIGGVDVNFPTDLPSARALDVAVRAVRLHWKNAVFQSGSTGLLLDRYASIPFAQLNEVFVYRDEAAFASWARLGADPSHDNQMIHLASRREGRLTAVVDDDEAAAMCNVLQSIGDALRDRSVLSPRFTPVREAA